MEPREDTAEELPLPAYAPAVADVAERLGVSLECRRLAIHDMSVPSPARMAEIESAIEASLVRDRPVYLHCWRGRGRTGTVVGVYLIRRGLATPDNFVEVIRELRAHHADLGPSPETGAQVEFVRSYVTGAYRGA
jgi:protein-tyrosine phosphatase